jgi:Fuc2NAc and GlcNAc transferase
MFPWFEPMIIFLMFAVPVVSFIASYFFPIPAKRFGFFSVPNYRSLHAEVIPRGAGVVVAGIMLPVFFVLKAIHYISPNEFMVLFWGGLVVSLVGLLDDRFELPARFRFVTQLIAAIWVCHWLGASPKLNLGFSLLDLGWTGAFLAVFFLVWFYNLFNFIDGIDGMAISSIIFVSFSAATLFFIKQEITLSTLLVLLGLANIGLLYFNWPPARIFLGEAGTYFNSYALSAIVMASLWKSTPILWVWLILLAYYLTDTTMTTLVRLFKYPKTWYKPHRSHAYQNLARIWDNHLKMLGIVWAINLLWLLPLALLAFFIPDKGWLFFLIAYLPIIAFALKFGPLYEDQ